MKRTAFVLISAGALWQMATVAAAIDAPVEVTALIVASSATLEAIRRSGDPQILAGQRRIADLRIRLRAGDAAARVALAALESDFLGELAARDRAFAIDAAVLRNAATKIAATPEGAAALERFNAGDEAEALTMLDQAVTFRAKELALQSAAEKRQILALALEAFSRGKIPASDPIGRLEAIVALDPNSYSDWIDLARLYRRNGRTADSRDAALKADRLAGSDRDHVLVKNELGDTLLELGDKPGAYKAYEEATAIARKLAAAAPKDFTTQRDLIVSLMSLGDAQFERGDIPAARSTYDEMNQRLATLGNANMNSQLLLRDLVAGLRKTGEVDLAEGRLGEARKALEKDLEIARKVSGLLPDDQDALRDIYIVLGSLAALDRREGNAGAEMIDRKAAVDVTRRLVAADPASARPLRDLFDALVQLADAQARADDAEGARGTNAEASDLADRLVPLYTAGGASVVPAMRGLNDVGDGLTSQRDLQRAFAIYRKSFDTGIAGAESEPDHNAMLRQMARAASGMGNIGAMIDNKEAAVRLHQQAVTFLEAALQDNARDIEARDALLVARARLGYAQLRCDDIAAGRASFIVNLDAYRKLLAADPGNVAYERGSATSLAALSDIAVAAGDRKGSRQHLEEAAGEYRMIVAKHPEDMEATYFLALSLDKLAGLVAGEDHATAVSAGREAVGLFRTVAARDPSNTPARRSIWVALFGLASLDPPAATWHEVRAEMARMAAAKLLTPRDQADYEAVGERIKAGQP